MTSSRDDGAAFDAPSGSRARFTSARASSARASSGRSLAPISFIRATPTLPPPPPPRIEEGRKMREFYESVVNSKPPPSPMKEERRSEGRKTNDNVIVDEVESVRRGIRTKREAKDESTSRYYISPNRSSQSPKESPPSERIKVETKIDRDDDERSDRFDRHSREEDVVIDRTGPKLAEIGSSAKFPLPISWTSSSSYSSFREKRLRYKYFSAAQRDDVQTLVDCLDQGVGVDEIDDFGWTALMISASAGCVDVVRHLVAIGCDKDKISSGGVTALSLANDAGAAAYGSDRKMEIVNSMIGNGHVAMDDLDEDSTPSRTVGAIGYCESCDDCYVETDATHLQSVSHLLRQNGVGGSSAKRGISAFGLRGDNRGFRLMVDKMGWDANSGLGKEGEGRRYPIKTRLKLDRQGLGVEKRARKDEKISHFGPHDESAIRRLAAGAGITESMTNRKTLSRKEAAVKKTKERRWEVNLRRYMNE